MPLFAQSASSSTAVPDSLQKGTSETYYFPGNSTVALPDGNGRKVSELLPGDSIRCLSNGKISITHVRQINCDTTSGGSLTALYLRPYDELSASRQTWPLVPALLLEVSPSLKVPTDEGTKMISQLKKGDVLYRLEPTTHKVTAWKVGIVQRNARRVTTLYSLVTEEGSYLLDTVIALD